MDYRPGSGRPGRQICFSPHGDANRHRANQRRGALSTEVASGEVSKRFKVSEMIYDGKLSTNKEAN